MVNSEVELRAGRVDIVSRLMPLYEIVRMIKNGIIDMTPELQRHPDLWKPVAQSRLIESLLLGIPLQSFYFSSSGDGVHEWQVIDGLQRLSTIANFIVHNKLRLKGLEYLAEYNGRFFEDLPQSTQSELLAMNLQVYVVRPGTPLWVRFNIFQRLNTGGLPLNRQEIRTVLLNGPGIRFVNKLATESAFIEATRGKVGLKRMADRELANRFVAFRVLDAAESYSDLDSFLNDAIRVLDVMDESSREELRADFIRSMTLIRDTFGEYAFRRYLPLKEVFAPGINKAIFDAVSVAVAEIPQGNVADVLYRGQELVCAYKRLFEDDAADSFGNTISKSTGDRKSVLRRLSLVREMMKPFRG